MKWTFSVMQVLNIWTNASPTHEVNCCIWNIPYSLTFMTGRNSLACFLGTAMGVTNKDLSMYFVSVWQYSSICHYFIMLPMEISSTVPVYFQPLPALLISTTTPFSEASSDSRIYKALVSAVWHTLESVEDQNHPTSLQVPYSLQHPVLVWLTLWFLVLIVLGFCLFVCF